MCSRSATEGHESDLLDELKRLQQQVSALEQANRDLLIALEATAAHGDTIEAELYAANRTLQAEIAERKLAQATLQSILETVTRSKADLEIILQTMVEHGDIVEYDLYNRAVDLMRQSEERFRAIAEAVPIAMMLGEALDGAISYANAAAGRMLGVEPQALVGRKLSEFYCYIADAEWVFDTFSRDRAVRGYELQLRRSDGTSFWAVASIHSLDLPGQSIVLKTLFDISERIEAEAALRRSEAKLREQALLLEQRVEERTRELRVAEAELRALFAAMSDTILVFDRSGECLKVATAGAYAATLAAGHERGKALWELFPVDLADRQFRTLQQVLDQQHPAELEYSLDLGDREAWFSVKVSPLSAHTAIWVARDISDRKRWELELEEAKETAEIASRARGEFLANMSHELRTPLNAILGFAQLVVRDPSLSPENQEFLRIIGTSGEHLLSLIDDVLEMSKLEAGRVSLGIGICDLYDLLESLMGMLKLKAQAKQLQLSLTVDPDVPRHIRTDVGKLRQILINLLGNAVKFTQVGSVALHVSCASEVAEPKLSELLVQRGESLRHLHFTVADTGAGIAAAELDSLFSPFVQTQTGRLSNEGTGLGLAISRRYARLLGGDISVTSQLGVGSTFEVFIQAVAIAAPPETQSSATSTRIVGLEAGQPTYRILVADARPRDRQLLLELLAPVGFEVRVAFNAQEAVALWQAWQPHVLWIDPHMTFVDGETVVGHIRNLERDLERERDRPPTIVLAWMPNNLAIGRDRLLALGCDDAICQPASDRAIFDKLALHLGVRYTYAPVGNPSADCQAPSLTATLPDPPPTRLTASVLQAMPSEWIERLHKATVQADREAIEAAIAEIPHEQHALAQQLRQLVGEFDFRSIYTATASLCGAFLPVTSPVQSPAPTPRALRILVAEDNPVNQRVISRMLQRLGYSVQVVPDGNAALAAMRYQPYDLILMDLQMPYLDGIATTERILQESQSPGGSIQRRPIVIGISASSIDTAERCLAAGMDDYLNKPVRMDELQRLLERWERAIYLREARGTA